MAETRLPRLLALVHKAEAHPLTPDDARELRFGIAELSAYADELEEVIDELEYLSGPSLSGSSPYRPLDPPAYSTWP